MDSEDRENMLWLSSDDFNLSRQVFNDILDSK